MDSLQSFQISSNRFMGPLPEGIRNFSNFEALGLRDNTFMGPLLESIGNLSNLEMLDVAENSLTWVISEAHFSNFFKLTHLSLEFNSLILRFSYDLVPPFQLHVIYLSSCRLRLAFPKWIQSQNNYVILDISNAGISYIIPALLRD